ncbi:hypothetical protein CS060_09700 [Anoxybacillus flavithermus]|uniref:Phosphoribulokinase/uridine kinase domain-containing protein n=1 Tax=Anoxybacillus flavithermus TaxID=33934 RepID=A0A2G5RP07_9BACL|nr:MULTISPECIES: hypothetical protein [Anoxybacillus]PIC04419.1 hypothetical protein CS060_09700 [Anoxybacillus flavithermus]
MSSETRQNLIKNLCSLITLKRLGDKPLIVGITGMDTSGKTQLTAELDNFLKNKNIPVQTIHVDDFHNPKSIRYASDLPEPEQYYERSIDFNRLVHEVLLPIRRRGQIDITLTHLELLSDTWSLQRRYNVTPNTIVLLEGVFLFRQETRPLIDFFVYLHVSEEVIIQRARLRDVPTQGDEVIRKYYTKYLPAQRKYLKKFRPDLFADVVIDNTDWVNPKILVWPKNFPSEVHDAN